MMESRTSVSPDYRAPHTRENLSLLYQGVLTGIVRLQSGRQPIGDASAFRKRMKEVISEIEREAIRLGYDAHDISDTNYAVVAFLDEAVLTSSDPNRTGWSSLQAEMYEQAVAGERFFDQLKALLARRDSAQAADILEVYGLCLLLGYQGRYALGQRAELRQLTDEVKARVEGFHGSLDRLSPAALPAGPRVTPIPQAGKGTRWQRFAVAASVVAVGGAWLVFRLLLGFQAGEVRQGLQKILVP